MPSPTYTYTLTNGTTADASQVQQNFSDILNGVSDGTKDLSINALTVAGTATLNGDINLGNSSADTITITGTFGSVVPLKGVSDGSSAAAGKVGEYMEVKTTVPVNFPTNGTFGDLGSLALTAGDWELTFVLTCGTNSSTMSYFQGGITTTSGNSTSGLDIHSGTEMNSVSPSGALTKQTLMTSIRVNISSTTTYYAKVSAGYSAGNPQYSGILRARRVR